MYIIYTKDVHVCTCVHDLLTANLTDPLSDYTEAILSSYGGNFTGTCACVCVCLHECGIYTSMFYQDICTREDIRQLKFDLEGTVVHILYTYYITH